VTCRVAVFNNHGKYRAPGQKTRNYVMRVLRLAGIRKAEIRVVFVDSQYCRKINKQFLEHNNVTDVVSFPLESRPNLEGEIYVNIDRARQQARDFHVSIANEVARLVIHGVLHLVGYDDATPGRSAVMKKTEDAHVRYWFSGKG